LKEQLQPDWVPVYSDNLDKVAEGFLVASGSEAAPVDKHSFLEFAADIPD
jgi:hypothetical protein